MPNTNKAHSSTATEASGWRRLVDNTRITSLLPDCGRWSLDHVDAEEQENPDHVDEVPVVRHDDGVRGLFVGESPGHEGAAEHEEEGDQTQRDVNTVDAGREVEDRPIGRTAQREALVHGQLGVLVDLAGDEDRTHDEGEDEPLA